MAKKKQAVKYELKQYLGISRDHSGSMSMLARAAAKDYNDNIAAIKEAAEANKVDTIVSVVKCGVGYMATVEREVVNSNVQVLQPIGSYVADGRATPLFDSVGELIELLSAAPDSRDPKVSFLIMAITDGQENSSRRWTGTTLGQRIQALQATDRWTFVFRVPIGHKRHLVHLGIPAGNILEWEQTEQGVEVATVATRSAFESFYSGRTKGVTSTGTFYADLKNVAPMKVRAVMDCVTPEVTFWSVPRSAAIRDFVDRKLGHAMIIGGAFYQLTKPEKAVQDYKLICIRNKKSGAVYGGEAARKLLGLPKVGSIKLAPGNHGEFDIFVQSTSVNRKLVPGTEVLYWPGARR